MKDTPWGIPEYEAVLAEGIIRYSTDCHGGIWLSPERQQEIGYDNNWLHTAEWWEEDYDWSVPFSFFCKEIWMHTNMAGFDDVLRQAINIVKRDHSDMLTTNMKKVEAYRAYKQRLIAKGEMPPERQLKHVDLLSGVELKITVKGGTA